MSAEEILDIVDDDDNVIGKSSRKEIHAKGLRHRETQVLFITPAHEIIFQRRSMTKDTNPGLLTVAVGGHVEMGDSYEATAIKEMYEETGLRVELSDLVFLSKVKVDAKDPLTNTHNVCNRQVYGYVFKGHMTDLHVESGQSDGFFVLPAQEIFNLSDDLKKTFTSTLSNLELYGPIYQKLLALVA